MAPRTPQERDRPLALAADTRTLEGMSVRTVIVCEAQVPFVRGGAELHVRSLVAQLRARGYLTEIVSLPFKWYPKEEILSHAAAWRLIDLSESNGQAIDLVFGTKFPSYFVRHPNKVTWLIHQHRAAYELCGTEYSDFRHTEQDVGLRQAILDLDRQMLANAAGCSLTPRTPRTDWPGTTDLWRRRCIIRRRWQIACTVVTMATTFCLWGAWNR